MAERQLLSGQVGRALRWSTTGTLAVRLGNLGLGIVIARIVSPEEFGLYAIALTVQSVVMALADLGLSADLIRHPDHERRAGSVATLGLVTGGALTVAAALSAPALATAMGGPGAAGPIAILAGTFLLAGIGVVPFATLQRRLDQRGLFRSNAVDFGVGAVVTLVLAAFGHGLIGLAVGRVAGQASGVLVQFWLTRTLPRLSWDRTVARSVLAFGLPVAAANLLSWVLLSVDRVVLGNTAGAVELGYYVLAANISTWPMTLVGQVLRSVTLPAFSRVRERAKAALVPLLGPVWWAVAAAAAMLAALAHPVVVLVYGARWEPAVQVLVPLATVGAVRVIADVLAGYLYALGRSRGVLVVQTVWLVALVPAVVVGAQVGGGVGVGVAQAIVAVVVLVPAYLVLLRRSRDEVGALVRALVVPALAAAGAVLAGMLVADRVAGPILGGLLGGATTLVCYLATTVVWVLPRWRAARVALDEPDDTPDSTPAGELDDESLAEPADVAAAPAAPAARPRGTTP
ncbi:oligosaccharide flippase family protein [Promicromonospora panici]|uniref:oligosaccharide flippase family protein n=1 Tax=Promicromonospora panici TaxID=2219658 RepID=UPI00101E16EB|nr:oligosaccharide flippase family protein [Promicromonospora panici]